MTNYLAAALAASVLSIAGAAQAQQPVAAAQAGPRYTQADSGSKLAFTFTQLGAATTGRFETFTTELVYDPAQVSRGSLLVRVDIGSLDTGDAERDAALSSADLLDARNHPTATYVAGSLARGATGGLEAVGRLTLRGVSRDLRLPLSIEPSADGLVLSGQATIKRLEYGVGQGEWQATDSVGDEVKIEYRVALVRATGQR